MTEVPDPPDWCRGQHALNAWTNGYEAVTRRMAWDSGFEGMLAQMAMFAASYVRLCMEANERHPGLISLDVEERRRCARGLMADYMLLAPDMIGAPGTIRADGLDADIAALCDVSELQ
jgi:hypothetical protein